MHCPLYQICLDMIKCPGLQDKCIEGIIYVHVQSTEMEEKYVRFHRVHIQKYVDRKYEKNHYLNKRN